jgi:asparagine synthase (glutamine-hydrolysing)
LLTVPQDGDDVLEVLDTLAWHLDAPAISPAIVPLHRVMRAARADGTPVLLDGQGADEILAGYHHFHPPFLHDLARRVLRRPSGAGMSDLIGGLGGLRRHLLPSLARSLLPGLDAPYRRLAGIRSALTPDLLAVAPETRSLEPPVCGPLNAAQHRAHAWDILPGLLHYGDAVSMASSVECRQPFMDYRLVEYCFRLPPGEKIGRDGAKSLLRRSMAGVLTDEVRLRGGVKNGFNTPMGRWLRTAPGLADLLAPACLARHGVLRSDLLSRVAGIPDRHLLRWVSTALWFARCIDSPR